MSDKVPRHDIHCTKRQGDISVLYSSYLKSSIWGLKSKVTQNQKQIQLRNVLFRKVLSLPTYALGKILHLYIHETKL